MFEEHFTNARNAGLKVGVYFFTQAVNEAEAQEEAEGCNWALNGRKLDYPIYYDTEASTSPNGTGRADGLGKEDRTKCAIAFCEEVKSLGYKPGVYASTTWFRKRVDLDALRKYTIWNAHYGVSSSPIGCDMWQGTRRPASTVTAASWTPISAISGKRD
jgi:GH25 family lysozyme M1 (1,4-beta-N-acetylmuramidase)